MSDWIKNITNEHVLRLTPYESARRLFSAQGAGDSDIKQLWLNANEAPQAAPVSIDYSLFNRYPDCQPAELIAAYASYAMVSTQQVVATRGADEGIELLIRAFCQSGKDSILICPPTYGMYAISAETFNIGVERAPLTANFALDTNKIREYVGNVNLVFLCSPNNPTGTVLSSEEIEEVLIMYTDKALVVVDEAYIEFCPERSVSALLSKYPNLVILRTLSKAFALAGIRCGFTIAGQDIISTLLKVIAPYPVPAPVAQIANQSLNSTGQALMKNRAAEINQELLILKNSLMKFSDIEIVGDTNANFILFRHPKSSLLMNHLVKQGLYIRDQSKQLNLANCLRITAGTKEQNLQLLDAMESFFSSSEIRKQA